MFGILNVYKPKGKTSHDVVAILRKITKVKQIGHTGTLDPFAEGVLPVCVGKATRLIEYLNDDKAYVGTIKLGEATSTYDTEGEVTKTSDKKVTLEDINPVLSLFCGEIEQLPPIYSAIKVNGKKLYEYARNGEEVEIKPRKVFIRELNVVGFDFDRQELKVYIDCSKGTYIRSIAHDLGEALGTYGHLIKLVRVKAGDFVLDSTVRLEDLKTVDTVSENLHSPLEFLDYPKYELNDFEREKVRHGMRITVNMPDGLGVFTHKGALVAIVSVEKNLAKTNKVFI
jgi:tRNA pseudouridine55 synthase